MSLKNTSFSDQKIAVVIPAYNEESSIAKVLRDIPDMVNEVVVVDNNSKDNTAQVAREGGATVLKQPLQGYGNACLMGIHYFEHQSPKPDILVFLDADYSDHPEQLPQLIQAINSGNDLVIGSRALGDREAGSMTFPQVFGNALATRLLYWWYGEKFTDLGPFRAIRFGQLLDLEMQDPTYGWTVEMQLKAAKKKLRCAEVPVDYRRRIGKSKISGTVKGTVLAGYKIISTLIKYR